MKKKDYILIIGVVLVFVIAFFATGNKDERGNSFSQTLENTKLTAGINDLDYNYFEALVNASDEATVVYLGSATCSWCTKYTPNIESVAKENNINVIYIDLAKVNQTEYNNIVSATSGYFTGGTPTTLILKDGKVVDSLGGYNEIENIESFFKENGII